MRTERVQRAQALVMGMLGLFLATGCLVVNDNPRLDPGDPDVVEVGCWATGVTDFSSSSLPGSNDFAPTQATGIADTQDWDFPVCVDDPRAWSPAGENDGAEFIDLLFAVPIHIDRIRVFENFGPGATVSTTLVNTEDPGVPVELVPVPIELQGPGQPCSVLALDIDSGNGGEYTVEVYDKVLFDLDTSQVVGFNEIDAVQIVGLHDLDFGPVPGSCDIL